MVRRIHVAVKYWNLQSANAKHYQTVHELSLKWPNLCEDRINIVYISTDKAFGGLILK